MQQDSRVAPAAAGPETPAVSATIIQFRDYLLRSGRVPRPAPVQPVSLACRHYMLGREDWERGLQVLVRSYVTTTRWTYAADGSLRLHDVPTGEVVLSADEVRLALKNGITLHAPDFEADIAAAELAGLLAPLAERALPQFKASR